MTSHEPNYDKEPSYGMRNALRLVLMFYAVGPWHQDRRDEWRRLTGTYEATTKVLCDHVRSALAVGAAGDAGESERLYGLKAGHVLTERDAEDIHNLVCDHNDEIGIQCENYHLGRVNAFYQIGGQKLVDEMLAKDKAMGDEAVRRAMEKFKDMGGRQPESSKA